MHKLDDSRALVVIDAMKGFTTEGTFGRAFGEQDVRPIDETFARLQNFIDVNAGLLTTKCLVRSVYPAGKFTYDPESPLYHLCAEGSADLIDAIRIKGQWLEVQKAQTDATTEPDFTAWLEREIIKPAKQGLIFTGCTLTTCVSRTALSVRRFLDAANREKTAIVMPLNLIGSRSKSRIDPIVEELRDQRITVLAQPQNQA